MKTIRIPSTVSSIGINPIYGITPQPTLIFNSDEYFKEENGMILTSDGTELIVYLESKHDTDFVLPETITTIKPYAIYDNVNLEKIIIPKNVDVIEENGIAKCSSLHVVYHLREYQPETFDESIFTDCDNLKNIFVGMTYNETLNGREVILAMGTIGTDVYYHYDNEKSF